MTGQINDVLTDEVKYPGPRQRARAKRVIYPPGPGYPLPSCSPAEPDSVSPGADHFTTSDGRSNRRAIYLPGDACQDASRRDHAAQNRPSILPRNPRRYVVSTRGMTWLSSRWMSSTW